MSVTSMLKGLSDVVDPDMLASINAEIAATDSELEARIQSQISLVQEVGHHTLAAGGKRIRPALVTLSARACAAEFEVARTRKLGACMELIHMATLIHDDVIDHSPTRRGRPTASAVFGNTASILSGDVLLAKSMVILAEDGDLDIIRRVSSVVVELAEGEVRELEARGNFDLTEVEHREILRLKTASFIQVCCELGGYVADRSSIECLGAFGYHLGMAFQIVDDVLDYRGDQSVMGKQQATDFCEGCATLPLIYLRESCAKAELGWLEAKFGQPLEADDLAEVSRLMIRYGIYERTLAAATTHIECGIAAIDQLPETPSRSLLAAVARFVVSRDK